MRILPVNNYKSNTPTIASKKEYSNTYPNYNTLPFDIPFDTINFQGRKKTNSKGNSNNKCDKKTGNFLYRKLKFLNMKAILSLPETKRPTKAKPKSFEESDKKFTLDRYQKEAIESFKQGNTTIVTAPTGTGKTLIAEYAIDDALKSNETIIYLSPLKALSNEKFVKFGQLFGEYDENGNLANTDNIGLITGDTVINPYANLLVMTTEVYRNALTSNREGGLKDLISNANGVIYDEFHYLGDKDRGTVWEEAVMSTPKHVKQLMLSATASNAAEISEWINRNNPEINTKLVNVPENERHVPLRHFVFGVSGDKYQLVPTQKHKISIGKLKEKENLSDRQKEALSELEEFAKEKEYKSAVEFLYSVSAQNDILRAETFVNKMSKHGMDKLKAEELSLILSDPENTTYITNPKLSYEKEPDMAELISQMDENNMTPALVYIFSKKGCNEAFFDAAKNNGTLLTEEESRKVLDFVNEAKNKGVYLGADFDKTYLKGLLSGYAVHHAGMLPAYKSLVENLAREGLVKVCFATETLIAGINMPFKTSVFTSFEKPDNNSRHTPISPATFTQGAGRAGRRGKDLIGNVIVMPKSLQDYRELYLPLAKTNDTSLKSAYTVSYNSLLGDSLLNDTENTLKKSFAYYQDPESKLSIVKNAESMKSMLLERDFIAENEDGTYSVLEKGKIARKIYGVNEILMTEILTNPKYTQDLRPEDLVALTAAFADVKDNTPTDVLSYHYKDLNDKLAPSIELAKEIQAEQEKHGINLPIKYSLKLVPSIYAYATAEPENSIEAWNQTMDELKTLKIISHEGDYLRVINSTIDLLKTISYTSEDEALRQKAKDAIKMLQKSPVTDISSYELKQ